MMPTQAVKLAGLNKYIQKLLQLTHCELTSCLQGIELLSPSPVLTK